VDDVESNDIPLVMSLDGRILASLGDWREHQKGKTSTGRKKNVPLPPAVVKPVTARHPGDRPMVPLPVRVPLVRVSPDLPSVNPRPLKRPRTKDLDMHDHKRTNRGTGEVFVYSSQPYLTFASPSTASGSRDPAVISRFAW
jgi:hypothetical protein